MVERASDVYEVDVVDAAARPKRWKRWLGIVGGLASDGGYVPELARRHLRVTHRTGGEVVLDEAEMLPDVADHLLRDHSMLTADEFRARWL